MPTRVMADAPSPAGEDLKAWAMLPFAPVAVVVLGLAVALAVGAFGVLNLSSASDAHAAERASLIASTLAARLRWFAPGARLDVMQRAARKTGAEIVVASPDGKIALDASLGLADPVALRRVVQQGTGEAFTGLGRTRFAVTPLDRASVVVVFVREPSPPEGEAALLRALLALTTLLVGVATAVAYAVARDANGDVEFVAYRVRAMSQVRAEPAGEAVPVRTMNEVGAMTIAFNALVERFAAAQSSYQADLERVRAADRDQAAFLAAVSHELRSPLNAILGFADILISEVEGPLSPAAREDVDQIRASGKHLLDLINDILELSALESGQLKLSRSRVELGAIAADVVREALGLVGARPVTLRVERVGDVYARADPRRVRQMLTNLVGNAVKFTPRGEVVVRIDDTGRFARFSVRDTGPGLGPQERAFMFQEYKQTKAERARRRGTGLGLAITRRLAEMHGGSIDVESELGRGAKFTVLLPLWSEKGALPSDPAGEGDLGAAPPAPAGEGAAP